jgi:hypothetical protein
MRKTILAAVLLAFGAFAAQAQEVSMMKQGDVAYIAGGVGVGERNAMSAMKQQFNTRVTFAVKKTGNFVANVGVTVEDAKGAQVLKANVPGPLLYAQFAPGEYRVRAVFHGVSQTQALKVPSQGHSELYFYWDDPAAAETMALNPERLKKWQ